MKRLILPLFLLACAVIVYAFLQYANVFDKPRYETRVRS